MQNFVTNMKGRAVCIDLRQREKREGENTQDICIQESCVPYALPSALLTVRLYQVYIYNTVVNIYHSARCKYRAC